MNHWIGYRKDKINGKMKWLFYKTCDVIEWFDVFGVKPSLCTSPMSGSLCGLITVMLIITLSILSVAWTLHNANNIKHEVL